MGNARELLEAALREPPTDLRGWIWSLAPLGKRVLVAAAAAVMTPAIEAWRAALARDSEFARVIGDDAVLTQARDAVHEWLRDSATAHVESTVPAATLFSARLDFARDECSGDGTLHDHAWTLASCVLLGFQAARWTEDVARRLAAGDADEDASRIAAGPAWEVAEAVHRYASETRDAWVVQRIVKECLSERAS